MLTHNHDQHIKTISSSSGQSILDMLELVKQQVEYHCFTDLRINRTEPLFRELCFIVAEVLVLNPDAIVKINGTEMYAHLVQEVYSQLENDHIQLVFDNFHKVSTHVYSKKLYLRTALYNAVFEIEADSVNDITVYGGLKT